MKKPTLLEKAKQRRNFRRIDNTEVSAQEKELAVAVAKGEISQAQCAAALGFKENWSNQFYVWAFRALRAVVVDSNVGG